MAKKKIEIKEENIKDNVHYSINHIPNVKWVDQSFCFSSEVNLAFENIEKLHLKNIDIHCNKDGVLDMFFKNIDKIILENISLTSTGKRGLNMVFNNSEVIIKNNILFNIKSIKISKSDIEIENTKIEDIDDYILTNNITNCYERNNYKIHIRESEFFKFNDIINDRKNYNIVIDNTPSLTLKRL